VAFGSAEQVERILDDPDPAPIAEGLRETLRFLRTVTLAPDATVAEDAARARRTGVSEDALADALVISVYFNLLNRLADAFGFAPSEPSIGRTRVLEDGAEFLERGYVAPAPTPTQQ
jgi:hypothetical protein